MNRNRNKRAPTSQAGRHLLEAVRAQVIQYEAAFGALPSWFRELEPQQALPLMTSLLRIGLKLPSHELLRQDMRERAMRGREPVRRRR